MTYDDFAKGASVDSPKREPPVAAYESPITLSCEVGRQAELARQRKAA